MWVTNQMRLLGCIMHGEAKALTGSVIYRWLLRPQGGSYSDSKR